MPAQLVKVFSLAVLLTFNDLPVLFQCDGALGFEYNFWPEPLGNERPRQPVHCQTEIVEFPQMDIRADRACFDGLQKMFPVRLDDYFVADVIQRLVFGRPEPTFLPSAM